MIIFEEHFFTIINKILLSENIDINELEKRLDNAFEINRLDNTFEINLKSKENFNFNSYKSIMDFKLDKNHKQYKIVNIDFSKEFMDKLNNKYNEFFEKERDKSIDKIKYNSFGLLYMYIHQNEIFYGFRYYFFEKNYDLLLKESLESKNNKSLIDFIRLFFVQIKLRKIFYKKNKITVANYLKNC